MNKYLSFDDVLLDVNFNELDSRSLVNLKSNFLDLNLEIPFISSNMDTITESTLAVAMSEYGAVGALHRFMDIDKNVQMYCETIDSLVQKRNNFNKPIVSIGVNEKELDRALALSEVGATHFLIDVAHGASMNVVKQYDKLRQKLKDNARIIVGNFANGKTLNEFNERCKSSRKMDAAKIGVGSGSVCTTRIVTGCGRPTFDSLLDCRSLGIPLIADGGIKGSGDALKSLVAGASALMIGSLLAGTEETSGKLVYKVWDTQEGLNRFLKEPEFNKGHKGRYIVIARYKPYRGSASKESYEVQGKTSEYRSPEGESSLVESKGSVKKVLQELEAGLCSGMTYIGAKNLEEVKNASFGVISTNGLTESKPHGVKK